MKISARNQFSGKIKKITVGQINAEVTIALPGGFEIVAVITKSAVKSMGLRKGAPAVAIVKASNVLVAVDE